MRDHVNLARKEWGIMSTPLQLNKIQKGKIGNCKHATKTPSWQRVYQQLDINKIENVTSYQVNNNLYIVVPLDA